MKRVFYCIAASGFLFASSAAAQDSESGKKPVQVYILSGQSNMVGIGQVTGGGRRWGSEFLDPVVSVYQGDYDPKADYDSLKPVKTKLQLPREIVGKTWGFLVNHCETTRCKLGTLKSRKIS